MRVIGIIYFPGENKGISNYSLLNIRSVSFIKISQCDPISSNKTKLENQQFFLHYMASVVPSSIGNSLNLGVKLNLNKTIIHNQ